MSDATGPRSTVDARYVAPSVHRRLEPPEKIGDLFERSMGEGVLQRLTDRVWWIQYRNYATTFYVGERGVLLFDAVEGAADWTAATIARVTDKPVVALVYGHFHADHIGDVDQWMRSARKDGRRLRIIGSAKTAEKMRLLGSAYPQPDVVVEWPHGTTAFEDVTVRLHGFEWAAHTDDHSAWLLVEEQVAHSPDLINPDELPFWHFGGSERFVFKEQNLRAMRDLDWSYLSGGHGNVGYREDIDFDLGVMADLRSECDAAMEQQPLSDFIDPAAGVHSGFLSSWLSAVGDDVAARLRPRYGDLYGYEQTIRPNAEMVALALYEQR